MKKPSKIILDMLILEEFCNSKCQYCEGYYGTGYRYAQKNGCLNLPKEWAEMVKRLGIADKIPKNPSSDDFFNLASEVIDKVREKYDISILKISGGEVFLYRKVIEFLKKQSKNFDGIQVLTNATLLNEDKVKELSKIKNLVVQISIDGVTQETNKSRNDVPALLGHVLRNIDQILENGIPLEINCVLTKYNTGDFQKMLDYFLDKSGNIVIVPRPVRDEPRKMLDANREQIDSFEKVCIGKYEKYSAILPPKPYLQRVIDLMRNNKRGWTCSVPEFVLGANNYGEIPHCIRTEDLSYSGNILLNNHQVESKVYNYNPQKSSSACDYCIVQYEIFDLFNNDLISVEDLANYPTFKINGVMGKMLEIKKGQK